MQNYFYLYNLNRALWKEKNTNSTNTLETDCSKEKDFFSFCLIDFRKFIYVDCQTFSNF
jgi:hypothetical protein